MCPVCHSEGKPLSVQKDDLNTVSKCPGPCIVVEPQYMCLLIPSIFEFASVRVQNRGVPVLLVQDLADSSTSTWTWWLCPLWAPVK